MPLTRYQIRNEYSLADPELYRAADKDDPEALLEGVAMAGLVGVLRQLGDLAEFAAEIFHDLHEEVMATAARGHGLVVRVQQLEAEFPTIEKAFLSQTSHSLFFSNTGVDWHPNLHMDQNLITQGDLPRFVMDSYEECRGPPRLFLLDKFDVAGAGACLKRYTDPSFFKVDSSSCGMTDAKVQREKKPRKAKKKGSRWRNGETPEVLPTSHAKLHQLFQEESVESHVNDPSRRVKLKRRMNGFPFNSKMGKSYMEKFLKSPTHDHDAVHDISVNSSPLKLPSTITGESGIEIYDIITVSPHEELPQRKRSPFSSLDAEESRNKPYMDELNEELNDEISEAPRSNCISQACNGASNLHEDVDEKEIAVDGERKRRGSLDSYQSDDIGSEVDNYMDALTTMDSEMETDSEYRGKNDMRFLNMDNQGMDSDANEEQQGFQAHCSDTQSIGNSTATDDGNSSSQKGIYSFSYSFSPSNMAENALSDGDTSMKILSSFEMCEVEIVNMPSDQLSVNEENASTRPPQRMICNGVCTEESNLPSHRSHFGETASSSCLTESNPTLLPVDQRKNLMEGALLGLESDEVSSHLNELGTEYNKVEENSSCPIDNLPCSSNLSDDPSLTRDNFHPQLSSENHSVVELDNEDPRILSHVSAHLSNILEFPEKTSTENLLDNVHPAECAEHECHKILADSQIESPHSVASHTEVLNLDFGQPEVETCDRDMEPNGIAVDFKKQQFPGISENILPHKSSSYSEEESPDESSNAAHGEDLDRFSPGIDLVARDVAEVNFASDYQNSPDPLSGLDAYLDDVAIETVHSKILTQDAVVTGICCYDNGDDGNSVSSSPRRLQEETISISQDVCQDGMEINEAGSLEHLQESATGKEVDQQAGDSSNLDPSDASSQELLNVIPGSYLPTLSGNSLHTADATIVPLNSCQQDQLSESKSGQQIDIIGSAENTASSPTHDVTELITRSDQKVELHDGQVDVESWHDQDSELRSSQQINVIDGMEGTSSSTDQYVAEWGTPVAEKFELQDGHFDEEPWHDQDSESNSAQQVNAIESTKSTASSTACHVAELRIPSEQKVELHDDHLGADSGYDLYSKSKSSQQVDVIMDEEDAESSPTHDIAEPKPPLEEKVELQYGDQFDVESPHANKPSFKPFSLVGRIRSPTDLDQESHIDDFSEFFVSSLPSQASVPELPQSDIREQTNEPSSSILPSFDIHAGISQINLNEMPPLPPLPPMQWRIGKVQHSFLASKRDPVGGNPDSFPHILPSTAGENVVEGNITQPLNPFLPVIDLEDEKSKPGHDKLEEYYMVHPNTLPLLVPPVVNHGNTQNLFPTSDGAQCTNPFLEMPTIYTEGSEHGFLTSEGGIAQPSVNPFSPVNNIEDTVSPYSSRSLPDNTVQPMQSLPDTTSEDRKFEETPVIAGGNLVDPPEAASPSKIQDEQPQHTFSTLDGQTAWSLSTPVPIPPQEDGKPNGERQVKLPRPRNPLIDAVAAIDKSKLRKVSEQVRPQVGQKVDERDSLLEQIRTKSFNLKPAVATRPSIQGPKTNLKVTAILEKANAIRQAFAGSDEDDSDSWSDS